MSARRDRETLRCLLRDRNEHPERLAAIDREIHDRFTEPCTVFVLDMSGFSRLTLRYGIAHFLAMIERLHDAALPIVRDHAGRVIKTEADNVFAVFPAPGAAVEAAFAVHARLAAADGFLPEDWDIHASIGIGHGDTLLVEDADLYGAQVNLASKLAEDIGAPGETLCTEAACDLLDRGGYRFDQLTARISDVDFTYYRVARR